MQELRGAVGSGCLLCGRATYDPDKKERPWARAVAGGRQVLVCPRCQGERAQWAEGLDRCPRCGSTRLSIMLGETVCRQCGMVGGWVESDSKEPRDFSGA